MLLLVFHEYYLYGMLNEETFKELEDFKIDDTDVQSLIELAKSWYYKAKRDTKNYEETLKRSIQLSSKISNNFIDLGEYYIKQGKIDLGEKLIDQGSRNKIIQKKFDAESLINYDEFIDHRIKGIINYIH